MSRYSEASERITAAMNASREVISCSRPGCSDHAMSKSREGDPICRKHWETEPHLFEMPPRLGDWEGPRAWAHRLVAKEKAGLPVDRKALELAKQALHEIKTDP